jgi:lipoprotein-anchoring transpeptidase ErfK/SrfK
MNKSVYITISGIVIVVLIMIGLSSMKSSPTIEADAPSVEDSTAQQLYEQAAALKGNKDLVEARNIYQKIITQYSDYENIESVQEELEKINMELIFSNTPAPQKTVVHEVTSGDTLGKLAKQYGTTIDLIKKSNHLKSDIIRIGQKLRIWTGQFNIHVDKSQNVLLLKDGDEVVKVYQVSTGADSSTPVGKFTVTTKLTDPVWFNRGVVVPPESPQNVLGSRWLGFDVPGYGIHGTIEPETIGSQITAGCVRMRNSDVEELYSLIPLGTQVVVVN